MLVGRVGKDSVFKAFPSESGELLEPSGNVRFPLVTFYSQKDMQTNEYNQVATWHQVICKRKATVKKGSVVVVEGKIVSKGQGDEEFKYILADRLTVISTPFSSRPEGTIEDEELQMFTEN